MGILGGHEVYYLCLAEQLDPRRDDYVPKEVAYERLKSMTGQDFGFDIESWKTWLWKQGLIRLRQSPPKTS